MRFVHGVLILLAICFANALTGQDAVLVKDCNLGDASSSPMFFGELNGKVLFNALSSDFVANPWVSDGTAEGTFMLAAIAEGPGGTAAPTRGVHYDGYYYFHARFGTGLENKYDLWRTDGTVNGTELFLDVVPDIGDYTPSSVEPAFALFNGLLYFVDRHVDGAELDMLWRTDGTSAGTTMITGDYQEVAQYGPAIAAHGDHLYFAAHDEFAGDVLYRANAAGIVEVVFAPPSFYLASISNIIPASNGLYFLMNDSEHGRELWWTNGTAAGTAMISDFDGEGPTGLASNFDHRWFHLLGDTLLFSAGTLELNRELWRSDGTIAGTYLVRDLCPGFDSSYPRSFFVVGNQLCFVAGASFNQSVLWRTDGTEAGTLPLDTLQNLQMFGVWNDVLFGLGESPPQLYNSHGGIDDLQALTNNAQPLCCYLVHEIAFGTAGVFLSAYTQDVGTELFLYHIPVGVADQEQHMTRVFPNPVDEHLIVQIPGVQPLQVVIRDSAGRIILDVPYRTTSNEIDVSGLVSGLYAITIIGNSSTYSARFVKR